MLRVAKKVMRLNLSSAFFLLPFFFLCCAKEAATTPNPEPEPETPASFSRDTLTYLALGDSYTIGHSVSPEERFPMQLANLLNKDSFHVSHVRIVAKTGWTTDELEAGIASANIADSTYSLVSLLIGVNNQYRGRPVATYKPEFEALLQQAIAFAGGDRKRVFVVSIPDYAFTPFGKGNTNISQGIDEYNAANKEIADAYEIRYFNITPISREGLDDPLLVASDGLHPSGKQYYLWAQLMLPGVKEMLKE